MQSPELMLIFYRSNKPRVYLIGSTVHKGTQLMSDCIQVSQCIDDEWLGQYHWRQGYRSQPEWPDEGRLAVLSF